MTVIQLPAARRAFRPGDPPLWRFLRAVARPLLRLVAPTSISGAENVPPKGGLIVAINHFSPIDGFVVALASPRPLHTMAKAELFEKPLRAWLLRRAGVFPVRRGERDLEALQHAVTLARAGHAVAIFVEGTFQREGRPGRVKPGAAMIAMAAGVPVLPCGIDTFRWSPLRERHCSVVFGQPIRLDHLPSTDVGYAEASSLIGATVENLWQAATAMRRTGQYDPRAGVRTGANRACRTDRDEQGGEPEAARSCLAGQSQRRHSC